MIRIYLAAVASTCERLNTVRTLTLISLGLSLVGALGCTNTQSPGAQLKIVGGREIGLSDTVATSTLALVQPERGLQAYCSGVLVGPNKAVTAAHCIQSEE